MTTHQAAPAPSSAIVPMTAPPVARASAPASRVTVQRKCACGGSASKNEEECAGCRARRVQRRARPGAAPLPGRDVSHIVQHVLRSSGTPLDPMVRSDMEARFHLDFGRVRVHTDRTAARSAHAIDALAYTVGPNIVFGVGQYAPSTAAGRQLLAHELAHVLQQRHAASGGQLVLGDSHSVHEQETDAFAARAGHRSSPGTPTAAPLAVARKEPPAADTEDCSDDQRKMLQSHLDDARTWVNDAAPKVASYAYFYANPRVTAVPADPGAQDVTRNALRDNFHTTRDGVLTIRDGFNELRSGLNGSITFECEEDGCAENEAAYVRGAFAAIRRLGDIHVCPAWFGCQDYYKRVTLLIHERAHQYPGATDHAYEHEAGYATLDVDDAIDNAESFAVTARQIYHGGARGPAPDNC